MKNLAPASTSDTEPNPPMLLQVCASLPSISLGPRCVLRPHPTPNTSTAASSFLGKLPGKQTATQEPKRSFSKPSTPQGPPSTNSMGPSTRSHFSWEQAGKCWNRQEGNKVGSKSQLPTPHAAPAELFRCYGEGAKSPLFALKCINVNNLPVTLAGLFQMVVSRSWGELSLLNSLDLGASGKKGQGKIPPRNVIFRKNTLIFGFKKIKKGNTLLSCVLLFQQTKPGTRLTNKGAPPSAEL